MAMRRWCSPPTAYGADLISQAMIEPANGIELVLPADEGRGGRLLRGDGLSFLAESLGNYRSAWKANGHPGEGSAYLRVPAYVGADERDGYDTPRAGIEYYFARQARMLTARHETGREGIAEALAALDYDEIRASRVAFGSAEQVIDRFKEFRDVLGIDGFVLELNAGGMLSADAVKASLDRLCHDVMPAFR